MGHDPAVHAIQQRLLELGVTLPGPHPPHEPLDGLAVLGRALYHQAAGIIARRLHAARKRLLDLYGPQGSGPGR